MRSLCGSARRPTNVVLPFGQTSNLCVDVATATTTSLVATTVYWANDGPGSLADYVSITNNLGVACIDYHHPAGPVTQGDTATITANGRRTGPTPAATRPRSPSQWAHIEIETRPDIPNHLLAHHEHRRAREPE